MKIKLKDLYDFNKETGLVDAGFIKVDTKFGYKVIEGVDITATNSKKLHIKTEKFDVKVSPEHLLYQNGWIKSKNLRVNDNIDTINGYQKIISIEEDNTPEDLLDIQVKDSEFFANNIRSHNSSFQEAFDFSIFGGVRGKSQKKVALKYLPNRSNKNTEVEIEFINNYGNLINFSKSLEPTEATFFENGENFTRKFKTMTKEEREKIIGFNFETYKSFISMSISDFANFINLKPEEKREIVNKLFNLQQLDDYLSIVKDIIKNNNDVIQKYQTNINTNNQTISAYQQNIKNIKLSGVIDKQKENAALKKELESKKEPYNKIKSDNEKLIEEIRNLDLKKQDLDNQKEIVTQKIFENKIELKHIVEKLEIYESGICPVCDTKLDDKKHQHDLIKIQNKKVEISDELKNNEEEKNNIILELTQIINQKETKIRQKNSNTVAYNSILFEIKNIHKKIIDLKEKEDYVSIDEIEKNISELVDANKKYTSTIEQIEDNMKIYEYLRDIFSTKGIRKTILQNIISPINIHLKEILNQLNSPYDVKLDDEFNAIIYEKLINEVNTETLSIGEAKKINVAIALSYLKLILKIRKLNILFLDEIFSSMQPKNVELALSVLKKFTEDYNINIIIIDPEVYFNENSNFGLNYFNRILKMKKKMNYSFIEDATINLSNNQTWI